MDNRMFWLGVWVLLLAASCSSGEKSNTADEGWGEADEVMNDAESDVIGEADVATEEVPLFDGEGSVPDETEGPVPGDTDTPNHDEDGAPDAVVDDGLPDVDEPSEVRAFPGAEGFGAQATGGRGGVVLKVTSLGASGPGTLQEALDRDEPRIIVFAVSGVIESDIEIPYGNVTIAGQTAPGGGITIAGRLTAAYDDTVGNIIVRHIRVRPHFTGGDGSQFDSIQFSLTSRFILDHVSVAFGVDETIDLYEATDATIQWCTIESSATSGHPEGMHNYGLINGPDGRRVSIHHNLFAHHSNRCPAIANGPAEVRNNVMYNVRHGFIHHNPASGPFNIVGNYFKDGPSASLIPFYFDDENDGEDPSLRYYLSDNFIDDPASSCHGVVNNPWTECDYDLYLDASYRAETPFDFTSTAPGFVPITTDTSQDAFDAVLDFSGAFPRDVVTRSVVDDARNGTGTWGAIIPGDLMAGLTPTAAPLDSDDDGMPDEWETLHGLDPSDGSDHTTIMPSGYTAIEAYINERADALLNQ